VVEHLPSMHEALTSMCTAKKKKKRKPKQMCVLYTTLFVMAALEN
jgi:hypothetical protein